MPSTRFERGFAVMAVFIVLGNVLVLGGVGALVYCACHWLMTH